MKKTTQMGVNTSNIITHCKATFDLCISDAAEIFPTAWYTKKQINAGANSIHTYPNNFLTEFIMILFLVIDSLI